MNALTQISSRRSQDFILCPSTNLVQELFSLSIHSIHHFHASLLRIFCTFSNKVRTYRFFLLLRSQAFLSSELNSLFFGKFHLALPFFFLNLRLLSEGCLHFAFETFLSICEDANYDTLGLNFYLKVEQMKAQQFYAQISILSLVNSAEKSSFGLRVAQKARQVYRAFVLAILFAEKYLLKKHRYVKSVMNKGQRLCIKNFSSDTMNPGFWAAKRTHGVHKQKQQISNLSYISFNTIIIYTKSGKSKIILSQIHTMKQESHYKWKVIVKFNNQHHIQQALLEYDEQEIPGNMKVRAFVDEKLIPKVKKLGWGGFGLWAQHEPVTTDTEFDDLNYQRKPDGTLTLDNEDHNCQYRAIQVPVVQEKECVVCCNEKANRGMICMHYCMCASCFEKVDRCPVCRKRKPLKK